MGHKARFRKTLSLYIFLLCVLACISAPAHAASDRVYEALDKLIRDTPAESMSIEWLTREVYQKYPEPQKMLKKILGQPGMEAKNQRMARLRQAIDLGFWIHLAKVKGWTPELTNQGKANGHRSDHDQTGWILVGPEGEKINRQRAFSEVQEMHTDWLRGKHGITPGKPDMTIFNGDVFLPDWTNAKMGSHEFIRELSTQLLGLRSNGEAYFSPGANKQQVHTRALNEGMTMHITWHDGKAFINGEVFDIEKFINGEQHIPYRKTGEIAARYRDVHKQPHWRLALGNAGENLRRYLTHLETALDRQKYGNRIVNEAFAPVTAVAYLGPNHELLSYSQVHGSTMDQQNKDDFKKKFIEQIYGEVDSRRFEEIRDLLDRSANIELDKTKGKPYSAAEYYAKELAEINGNPSKPEDLRRAEELFTQRHLGVILEGISTVLSHAMRQDMTTEGRKRNRSDYGKNHREGLRKLFFERRVEIIALFEAVSHIKDEAVRKKCRDKLFESAHTPGLRRMLERMNSIVEAGAIDDFLAEAAKTGKTPKPEDIIAEKERRLRKAAPGAEAKAGSVSDDKARQKARELAMRSLGSEHATNYKKMMELVKEGGKIAGRAGKAYLQEMYEGFDYLAITSVSLNMLHTYQVECLMGGKSGWPCQQALLTQGMHEMLWFLPKINSGMLVVTSLQSISEGNREGFVTLGLGGAALLGYPGGMHLYFVYNIANTGLNVTYGYVIAASQDDMVTQAFRSFPQQGKPGMRSGERGAVAADTPDTPIMWEADVPANHWDMRTRLTAAKNQFSTAISEELSIKRGLKPDTPAWESGYQELLNRYAFDLPYYQRMARAYEFFSPQIQRYIDDAKTRGLDMSDDSFATLEACLSVATDERKEESAMPRCLASAVEATTPVLDAFFNKYLEGWLG
ncbi:MAG TPA: hypothetical protein VN328_11780, partial [Thermodesulfovibrionales bacterium]|nr:hypothetical protein [Thermodesulfovibrionales bacterium]